MNFMLMIIAMIIIAIASIPLIILNTIRKIYRRESIVNYYRTVAVGFDQVGGSILYGQEDWTVSSWTYKLHINKNTEATHFMYLIDLIFGENHCQNSYIKEKGELRQ